MSVDVDALRNSIDIVEFIARYVELRKEGGELAGRCPFHDDTTPSLKVNPVKQVWACFACAEHEKHGADVFGFLMSIENCTFPEALEKLGNGHALPDAKPIKRPALKKPTRTLLVPPEDSKPEFDRRDFGSPIKVWTICTLDGQPWLYEARYHVEGEKQTRFWTYGRYGEADPPRWECKHPPNPRPFYGLEQLGDQKRQVMIHEAPKKAEAARALWPALAHLGMLGGAQQVANMDLEPLRGRRLVLLPDNDEAGRQAMERLAARLLREGIATEVSGINPDTQHDGSTTVSGWDVADSTDWTPKIALDWAKKRKTVYGAAQQDAKPSTRSEPVAAAPPEIAQDAPGSAQDVLSVSQGQGKGNGSAGQPRLPKQRAQENIEASRKEVLAGLVYTCIADVRPEAVKWLWPGRIPLGELTMIVGDPGLGKSQICASLASVVTNGGQWPVTRERAEVGSVLILSAEDNVKHTIRPRLDAAGADVTRCHTLQAVKRIADDGTSFEGSFNLAEDLAKLSVLMDHLRDVRMVIIDPVSAYLGGTDSHKNAEVRGMLAPLTTLAGSHRAAIILVSHLTKSQSTSALMRVQGSIAFAALCRAVWGVAADKDNHDRRLFMPLKNNLGQDKSGLAYSIESMQLEGGDDEPIQTSRIMWEAGLVDMQADEAFGGALNYEERDEMRGAKEFLTEALADGRVRASDVQNAAKQAGHSLTTLGRAKRAMKIISEREGFGPKAVYYWRIKSQEREEPHPPSWVPD